MPYKFTPGAIALSFVLLFPGLFIGRQIARLYSLFLSFILSADSIFDFLGQSWLKEIPLRVFPNMLHGFVGGMLAIAVSSLILKRANYEIVAYSISSILAALAILSTGVLYADRGLRVEMIDLIFLTIGIVAGVFALSRGRGIPMSE